MRRQLLLLSASAAAVPALVGAAACDPSLKVENAPGDGGAEGGRPPPPALPPAPSAGDDGGADADGGGDGGEAGVDGGALHPFTGSAADFASGEKLATTSSGTGYDAYVAWDERNVYFGMAGSDVGGAATNRWVLVYLGTPGVAGTTQGLPYNCSSTCAAQQPTLPFAANHHLRWKTDAIHFHDVQTSSGSAWTTDALVPLTFKLAGTFVELAVSRASLGSPSKLDVHMTMLIEDAHPGPGWTYAGAPSTSFPDGWNPSYTKYYEFDLTDFAKSPNAYTPKP